MKLLRVTNIQHGCVFDGPGVRTTVFLKGCSLRCPWCCNPETISSKPQWFVDNNKCILFKGNNSRICEHCERNNGTRPIQQCEFGVAVPVSADYGCEELYEQLLKQIDIYKETCGGVTFSGGEPLLQSANLVPLLEKLKKSDIHIAFETTLVVKQGNIMDILPYSDCFMVDLKLQPQMFLYDEEYIIHLAKMKNLVRGKQNFFRMVFINEVLEQSDLIINALRAIEVEKIEILLCHNLGDKKYSKLSLSHKDYTADKNLACLFVKRLQEAAIETTLAEA